MTIKIYMMKKICAVLICLISSIAGYSQSAWTVSVGGGLDLYKNKYYSTNIYEKFEDGKLDFYAGLGIGVKINDIVRLRVNCNYGEYSFGVKPKDSSIAFSESEKTLVHLDVVPRLDIKLLTFRKFDLLASPGVDIAYIIDSRNKTILPTGEESKRVYVDSRNKSSYTGALLGAIARYNIDRQFAVTLTPEYTYFFNKLYSKNDGNFQRFRVGLGFEWNI